MRRSCLFAIALTGLLPISTGCRQTTGSTAAIPIGTPGPLTPVGAGTAAAALSPLGQPTRVPPPATGSYGAPNNYTGGTVPAGQAYAPSVPYDSFSNIQSDTIGSGVAPAGFAQQANGPRGIVPAAGSHLSQPAQSSGPQSPMTPSLGGMKVIDLTSAPPPPGYQPPLQTPNYPATGYGTPALPATPYPGGQGSMGPYQPSYGIPQNFGPGNNVPSSGGAVQSFQTPTPADIAGGSTPSRIPPNGPSASIARRGEFPMQPSMTEPSFQGGSQFPSQAPSTEPVDNQFNNNAQGNLPWRRPGAGF